MLTFRNTLAKGDIAAAGNAARLPTEVNWIDAFRPEPNEIALLERLLGIKVPSYERMSEIETSSRLHTAGDHLYLSMPMIYHDETGIIKITPLGFVLSKDVLVTIHFKPIKACDHRQAESAEGDHPLPGGPGALVAVLDDIVDHLADELETLTAELGQLSHLTFRDEEHRPPRETGGDSRDLRQVLTRVGRAGALTSRIGETLLGISRIIPYVTVAAAAFLSAEAKARLKSLNRDVASLNDYEKHQSDKVQFLLDATLGMISVDQNNIFKILTIVSVVGIPPTFIASMYGMNFKNMPELSWTYGYQYGLALIVLSTLIPLIWFKWRGWW